MMTLLQLLTSLNWRATKDMTTAVGKNNLGGRLGAGWTDKETAVFLQLVTEIHVNVRYEMGNSNKMAPFTSYFKRSKCFLPQKWDNDTWLAKNAPPTAYLNELQLFAHFLLLHIYNQFNLMENYQSVCLFSIYPCTHPSTHHPSPA